MDIRVMDLVKVHRVLCHCTSRHQNIKNSCILQYMRKCKIKPKFYLQAFGVVRPIYKKKLSLFYFI